MNDSADKISEGNGHVKNLTPITNRTTKLPVQEKEGHADTATLSLRQRRQVKPIVQTKVMPDMPVNLFDIYKEYLEESKVGWPYKYLDIDKLKTVKSVNKKPKDKVILSKYPKLKLLVREYGCAENFNEINDSIRQPASKSFRYCFEPLNYKVEPST